jgi:polysaccharide export outer membrane protein
MGSRRRDSGFGIRDSAALLVTVVLLTARLAAQSPAPAAPPTSPQAPAANVQADYVVGAADVLTITSYDQNDLTGKFTVEADGTFTYPLIGRFRAGGLTLREIEDGLKKALRTGGFFVNPQLTVAVEQYKSQKIYIVGEVRQPGAYPLSGNMSLVEAIAKAGSTLPTASGEAVIVHAGGAAPGPVIPDTDGDGDGTPSLKDVVRVNLRQLENGQFSQNAQLRDGDTVFIPRAQSVYVFGQVKNPGAYALQQKNTTVLQALSLAGGTTDRGTTKRIKIIRIVNGEKKEIKVKLTDLVQPGDTIVVPERFF